MATMQNLDCSFCRRTFYKLEHLKVSGLCRENTSDRSRLTTASQRHERSHTGSRPYACDVCTRAFGRQDSLYRHMRLHSKDHAGSKSYSSPAPSRAGTEIAASQRGEDSVNDNVDPQLTDTPCTAPSSTPTVTMDRQLVPVRQEGLIAPDQSGYDLMWPDSEQLFRTIVSSGSEAGQQSGGVFLSYASPVSPQAGAARFGDQPPSIDLSPGDESGQLVSGVKNMVHSQVRRPSSHDGRFADRISLPTSHLLSMSMPLTRSSSTSAYTCSSCASYPPFLYSTGLHSSSVTVYNHCC